jgi:hypothetical protein
MTPEKRKKIKALMESPAATENEKEICRKLLEDNPEPESKWRPVTGYEVRDRMSGFQTPRSQASGDFWSFARQAGAVQDDARRQQQAAQSQASSLGDQYRAAQKTKNLFMEALARMMAEEKDRKK